MDPPTLGYIQENYVDSLLTEKLIHSTAHALSYHRSAGFFNLPLTDCASPRALWETTLLVPSTCAMETPSYRLQTPRRQPPPPLNFDNATTFWRTSTLSRHDSQTLLYDLPSATISPPTSPQSMGTPTSPASTVRIQIRNGRPTPPPSTRNRSQTPTGVATNDLEKFAEQCRSWSGYRPFLGLSHSLLSGITIRMNKRDSQ